MITEWMLSMADDSVKKLKERDPETLEQAAKLFIHVLEVGTELIKVSPKFRQAFAEVHSEFLKYPECRPAIEQAVQAYETAGQ